MATAGLYDTDFALWTQRNAKFLLQTSPSLRSEAGEMMTEGYALAVELVTMVRGLPRERFPERCPYTLDQLLDDEFFA